MEKTHVRTRCHQRKSAGSAAAKIFWHDYLADFASHQSVWMLPWGHPDPRRERSRVELGRRIKEHRARLGMSQTDLAREVFVTRQTVSNWETQRTYPDAQSLLLMSRLFGVSVDALLEDDTREMHKALAAGSKRMNLLGTIVGAFGLACVAWVIIGIVLDLDLIAIAVPAALLFAPASAAAFMIDKMRHDHQLFAYQSVLAFLAGEDPDVNNRYNQRVRDHWVARRVVQTVLVIIIGICCGWGAASIISTLVG